MNLTGDACLACFSMTVRRSHELVVQKQDEILELCIQAVDVLAVWCLLNRLLGVDAVEAKHHEPSRQVIVASGLIAYLGAFTPDFREGAVSPEAWHEGASAFNSGLCA